MADDSTVIVLLTITVIILSFVVVVVLGIVTVFLLRINRILRHIDTLSKNVAEASAWLTPVKLLSSIRDLFNR